MGVNGKTIIRYILIVAVALAFIFPVWNMISASFSSKLAIESGNILIPDGFMGNWERAVSGSWAEGIINSLIITVLSVVFTLLISFPAAYTISRYHFMADKHIFFWFLATRMAPAAALVLPYLVIFRAVGLWDTIPGVVIAYFGFNIPLAVWLFTSFMSVIPKEIDNQAFIDGYSLWAYFRKIFIPLCMPAIGVVSFFTWFFSWSDMFFASVLTSFHAKPLNALLLVTLGRVGYGVEYGLASAAGVITIIPGLVLLYWAKTYLSKGFTFGRI